MVGLKKIKRANHEKIYEDEKMYGEDKVNFGMNHGQVAYGIIRDNDLWDFEYPVLRELMYTIRRLTKYNADFITDKYFKTNPYLYYIDRFELRNFNRDYLLRLLYGIEELIEFKELSKIISPYK